MPVDFFSYDYCTHFRHNASVVACDSLMLAEYECLLNNMLSTTPETLPLSTYQVFLFYLDELKLSNENPISAGSDVD